MHGCCPSHSTCSSLWLWTESVQFSSWEIEPDKILYISVTALILLINQTFCFEIVPTSYSCIVYSARYLLLHHLVMLILATDNHIDYPWWWWLACAWISITIYYIVVSLCLEQNRCNHFDNILILFDFLPIFFSPQVKRSAIITYKHSIYELPNNLRIRILGN